MCDMRPNLIYIAYPHDNVYSDSPRIVRNRRNALMRLMFVG